MEEQSDTPRTDATQYQWTRTLDLARDLERELTAVTRERDEARALNAQWAEKAAAWFASPEAAQRLQGYRDLAQQVVAAQNERDEARAEIERLRSALQEIVEDSDDEGARECACKALASTEPKP